MNTKFSKLPVAMHRKSQVRLWNRCTLLAVQHH